MEKETWAVVFDGKVADGQNIEAVKINLAAAFQLNAKQVEPLFSNSRFVLKKNLNRSAALKYQAALEKLGASCRIETAGHSQRAAASKGCGGTADAKQQQDDRMICPACDCEQAPAEECLRCGTIIRKYLDIKTRCVQENSASNPTVPLCRQTGKTLSKNVFFLVELILLGLIFLVFGIWEKEAISYGPGEIAPREPEQTRITNARSFSFDEFRITPLAAFVVEARVLSKERYYVGNESKLSPFDLALGWRRMSDESVLKDIEIRQSNRFYFWRVNRFPISRGEIEQNSANMHIIPATDKIRDQLAEIRKGHLIRIQGYLVRVDSSSGWHWQSSLSRKDTGRGACEVIWAEELEIL